MINAKKYGTILLTLLFILVLAGCHNGGIYPVMYYQGSLSKEWYSVAYEELSEWEEEEGAIYNAQILNTDSLKVIGKVSEVKNLKTTDKKEFSTNMKDAIEVGAPVYEVIRGDELWLMVEGTIKGQDVLRQNFFGPWPIQE